MKHFSTKKQAATPVLGIANMIFGIVIGLLIGYWITGTTASADVESAPASEYETAECVCDISVPDSEGNAQYMESSIVLYEEAPAETYAIIHNPYEDISLTEDEISLCSKVVYAESRGESYEGQVAIAEVIFNRLMHDEFPNTITEVIRQKNAFSIGKTYTETQTQAVLDALSGMGVLEYNTDVVFFGTKQPKYGSYFCTIGNHIFNTYV